MLSTQAIAALLAVVAPFAALAAPAPAEPEAVQPVSRNPQAATSWAGADADIAARGTYWAEFCANDDCTDCSSGFDVSNAGCINGGAKSVRFSGLIWGASEFALVNSPAGDCPCQSACKWWTGYAPECVKLTDWERQGSFRFISGQCDKNNC